MRVAKSGRVAGKGTTGDDAARHTHIGKLIAIDAEK